MRTAFLAVALTGIFAVFAQAEENETIEISRSSYAAIAYSPTTGNYAYACDYRSRSGAETAALKKCGAEDATIACWVNYGFCALALGSDKSCWGVGWSYGGGSSNTKAKDQALEDCRNRTSGAHIAVVLSSDGQHLWDEKDHITIIDKNGNIYDGHGNRLTPTPSGSASANTEGSPRPK